jgi:hypothetical protein
MRWGFSAVTKVPLKALHIHAPSETVDTLRTSRMRSRKHAASPHIEIAIDLSTLMDACANAVINPLYQPCNCIFGCCERNVVLKNVI